MYIAANQNLLTFRTSAAISNTDCDIFISADLRLYTAILKLISVHCGFFFQQPMTYYGPVLFVIDVDGVGPKFI